MPGRLESRISKRLDKLRDKRFLYALSSSLIMAIGGSSLLTCMLCSGLTMHENALQGFTLTVLGILISLGIASGLLMLYYSFDPYEKEPWSLIMLALALGMIVAPLMAMVLTILGGIAFSPLGTTSEEQSLISVVLIAPMVEELSKGLCVGLIVALAWEDVNSPLDGFLYGAIVGLGFSLSENMLYIVKGLVSQGVEGFIVSLFVRWTIVIFLHQLTTSYVGTSLALAKYSRDLASKLKHVLIGFTIAFAIHFVWNSVSVVFTFMDPSKGQSVYYQDPKVLILSTASFFAIYLAGGLPLLASVYRYVKQEEKHILLTLRDLLRELNIPPVLAVAVVNPRYRRKMISEMSADRRKGFKELLRDLAFLSLLLKEESVNPSTARRELIAELLDQIRQRASEAHLRTAESLREVGGGYEGTGLDGLTGEQGGA